MKRNNPGCNCCNVIGYLGEGIGFTNGLFWKSTPYWAYSSLGAQVDHVPELISGAYYSDGSGNRTGNYYLGGAIGPYWVGDAQSGAILNDVPLGMTNDLDILYWTGALKNPSVDDRIVKFKAGVASRVISTVSQPTKVYEDIETVSNIAAELVRDSETPFLQFIGANSSRIYFLCSWASYETSIGYYDLTNGTVDTFLTSRMRDNPFSPIPFYAGYSANSASIRVSEEGCFWVRYHRYALDPNQLEASAMIDGDVIYQTIYGSNGDEDVDALVFDDSDFTATTFELQTNMGAVPSSNTLTDRITPSPEGLFMITSGTYQGVAASFPVLLSGTDCRPMKLAFDDAPTTVVSADWARPMWDARSERLHIVGNSNSIGEAWQVDVLDWLDNRDIQVALNLDVNCVNGYGFASEGISPEGAVFIPMPEGLPH